MNYTGFVMERWKFGAKATNIMKKEVFEWYVASPSWEGTFGAPAGDAFCVWFSQPLYSQGLFKFACGTTTFLCWKSCCKRDQALRCSANFCKVRTTGKMKHKLARYPSELPDEVHTSGMIEAHVE